MPEPIRCRVCLGPAAYECFLYDEHRDPPQVRDDTCPYLCSACMQENERADEYADDRMPRTYRFTNRNNADGRMWYVPLES